MEKAKILLSRGWRPRKVYRNLQNKRRPLVAKPISKYRAHVINAYMNNLVPSTARLWVPEPIEYVRAYKRSAE